MFLLPSGIRENSFSCKVGLLVAMLWQMFSCIVVSMCRSSMRFIGRFSCTRPFCGVIDKLKKSFKVTFTVKYEVSDSMLHKSSVKSHFRVITMQVYACDGAYQRMAMFLKQSRNIKPEFEPNKN